jgi:hypothetical protein
LKKILFGLVASVSLVLTACGGDVCGAKSKCSADPEPTKESIDMCKAATASGAKCASQYTAFANCSTSKQTCTDNKTDLGFLVACATEFAAYTTCINP